SAGPRARRAWWAARRAGRRSRPGCGRAAATAERPNRPSARRWGHRARASWGWSSWPPLGEPGEDPVGREVDVGHFFGAAAWQVGVEDTSQLAHAGAHGGLGAPG